MRALTTLSLPISLCRDLTLTGGSAHGLRMLLVAEHHRVEGAGDVTVPLRALLAATGSDATTLPVGVRNMLEMHCSVTLGSANFAACVDEVEEEPGDEPPAWDDVVWPDDGEHDEEDDDVVAQPVADMAVSGPDRGTYVVQRVAAHGGASAVPGRLHVAVSDGWQRYVTGPRVIVPMAELRALRTRCGMIMRLRAAALLADARSATVRLTTDDWSLYTTHDVALQPAGVVRGYLRPGLADLDRACPSLSVDMRERTRAGRLTGVDLAFRRERAR